MNADVHTVDAARPRAQAIAVRGDTIVAVGTNEEAEAAVSPSARRIDVGGRLVIPGLHDVHVHAVEAGINAGDCFFPSELAAADYKHIATECAVEQQGDAWVRGNGVFVAGLLAGDEQPVDMLDRAIPDRPALILDDLGHGAWANTAALQAAGYGEESPDPPGGILHRDPGSGRLSGIVFENAQQRLRDAAWPSTPENDERAYRALLSSLEELNHNGITSVSDAGGYWTRRHHLAWRRALAEGKLTVRASNAYYVFPDRLFDEQLATLKGLYSNEAGSLLRFNQAKVYVDGILDVGTSALLEPFLFEPAPPSPEPLGLLYFQPDELGRYVRELEEIGYQIHFHATGDRGVRLALDAVESAGDKGDERHRITHLYLVDSVDRARFHALGVVADLQLSEGAVSAEYAEFLRDLLGDERAAGILPAQALLDAGATAVLSSDWDAAPLSPFGTIERALTRSPGALRRLEDALRMYTLDASYLLHQDEVTGSIEVGKKADFAVLNQDLFAIEPDMISETEVVATVLGGEIVFQATGFASVAGMDLE